MFWRNNGTPAIEPKLADGLTLVSFPNLENALEIWLDIVQYGLSDKKEEADFYETWMTNLPYYQDDKCFFVLDNGVPAATITIVCDYEHKNGLIHMVACKPEFRGKGIGRYLSNLGLYYLKKEGMLTASLKTDDWRVPAIKGYLNIGFTPDVTSEPDYKERWDKIMEGLKNK